MNHGAFFACDRKKLKQQVENLHVKRIVFNVDCTVTLVNHWLRDLKQN